MSKVSTGGRVLLGLIYFVFGLNGFLHFIPMQPMPDKAMAFASAMMSTGYFMLMISGTQVVGGALILLSGIMTPLALVILAPVTVNILLFHIFLTPGAQNLILPVIMVALHLLAANKYANIYKPLFSKG